MKHAGTKTIETTRLILRKLELVDTEMMFDNWTSDDKVTLFLRWDAHKTIDETRNMIEQWLNSYQEDSTYYRRIYLKDGELIGSIGSGKVMEKAGMQYEGHLRHYYKTRDGFHDCSLYGIIRNIWEQLYWCLNNEVCRDN